MSPTPPEPQFSEQVREAGDMVIRSRAQTLRKAAQRVDPFSEIGTSGLRQFGGFVLEEWLQALSGRKAAWVWREMMDNDPTVGSILFAIRWLASGTEWRVEAGADAEAAELLETSMHDMSHTWGDFVSECLSFLGYGWALHEEVYKVCNGYQPERPFDPDAQQSAATAEEDSHPASSQYNDGKIRWRKLPIRAQETLLRWHFDGYSGLRAMEQIDWHGGNHKIPVAKALLFRTQTTRSNPEGRSIMRNAYTSYFGIKNIKQIEAIGIERDLAGIPVATPPPGVDLHNAGNRALLTKVQDLVTSIRRDEYEGVVLPQAEWKLELLRAAGSRQIDTDGVVRRYRQDIAASMLADWVLLGMDAVGSYAMVDIKSDLFGMALDGILDLISEVMNRYSVPRLLAINGLDVSDPPQITHGSAGRINLEKVGAFLNQLYLAGAPIPWSTELLKALFLEAGLPTNFEEQSDPDELPTAPKPEQAPSQAAQDAADAAQEDGERQAQGEAREADDSQRQGLSKAEVHRGAMVALYPHPSVAHALAQDGGEAPGELHITLAYLGDAENIERPEGLKAAVQSWAAQTPPLEGAISGAGRFTAGREPATYASPDLPGLPAPRERLVRQLEHDGFAPSREHGFTPHITLRYGAGEVPSVEHHALRFDTVALRLGSERHDFPLRGTATTLSKADVQRTAHGSAIAVAPHLQARAHHLSGQLQAEMHSALSELGEQAALAYMSIARKAALPSLHRIVAKVLSTLNLRQWVNQRLQPLLRNHAGRVAADTQRTLGAEIQIELSLGDEAAQRIADGAGSNLGLADIETGVHAAILEAVRQGLQAGENPVRTAARIKAMVPAGRFTHAGASYRAQLISRTETANLQRASALQLYRSNPRVSHIRLRDGVYGPPRSDSECMARDGDIVAIDDAESVHPNHVLCTLSYEPVVTGVLRPAPSAAPALALGA